MKATDLMIGDLVIYGGLYTKVIYIGQKISLYDGKGTEFTIDPCHIEPIPLTEEILVKISDFTVRGEYVISGANRYPYARIAWSRDKEKFYFSTLGSNCYLDYVHQLQHLLRLCGVQKEIEL